MLTLHSLDSDFTGFVRSIRRVLTARLQCFDDGEVIDIENAETIELQSPCVVLAPMPKPLEGGRAFAADHLLECPTIRFILSHPDTFVVCVTAVSREDVKREISNWVLHSRFRSQTPSGETLANRIGEFTDSAPLKWSFLTSDELDGKLFERLNLFASVVSECAAGAIYDPTGIRALLRSLFTGRFQVTDGSAGPWFAAVVDDDSEAAQRHAYFTRRLGYNPIVVDTSSKFDLVFGDERARAFESARQTTGCGNSLWFCSHEPDLLLVDKILAFAGKHERGDQLLRRVSAKKGALISVEASEGSGAQINKPVIGVHDLTIRYKETNNDDVTTGRVLGQTGNVGTHHRFFKHLRAIGNSLRSQAERTSSGHKSSLVWLETYELLRGFDGPLAALACIRIQEQEAREVCENYVPRDLRMWKQRLDEIDRMIDDAFGEGAFKGAYDVAKSHWRVRILRVFLRVADEMGMPQWVRDRVTSAMLEAEYKLQAVENPERAHNLRFVYVVLKSFNSWPRVFVSCV